MKRASLSVRPAPSKIEPPDLTDRLLDREAHAPAAPARSSAATRPSPRKDLSDLKPPAASPEPESPPPVLEASTTDEFASLDAVLKQAEGAAGALETAARAAPARYDVALRYRLDALAHHLRQVADFVGNLTRR
jgi:hypothetical protein